jgi:hypothetical protein
MDVHKIKAQQYRIKLPEKHEDDLIGELVYDPVSKTVDGFISEYRESDNSAIFTLFQPLMHDADWFIEKEIEFVKEELTQTELYTLANKVAKAYPESFIAELLASYEGKKK